MFPLLLLTSIPTSLKSYLNFLFPIVFPVENILQTWLLSCVPCRPCSAKIDEETGNGHTPAGRTCRRGGHYSPTNPTTTKPFSGKLGGRNHSLETGRSLKDTRYDVSLHPRGGNGEGFPLRKATLWSCHQTTQTGISRPKEVWRPGNLQRPPRSASRRERCAGTVWVTRGEREGAGNPVLPAALGAGKVALPPGHSRARAQGRERRNPDPLGALRPCTPAWSPNLTRVFLLPVPLGASPLLPFPSTTPTRAGAVGTRAYPRPRGAATMAEPEQAGSGFAPGWRPSSVRAASPHSRGPVPTRRPHLAPSSPVLQVHLQNLPVALKEALHIALPGLVAQAANVHPRHPGNGGSVARPQPP